MAKPRASLAAVESAVILSVSTALIFKEETDLTAKARLAGWVVNPLADATSAQAAIAS
jgi:hypothetical protein